MSKQSVSQRAQSPLAQQTYRLPEQGVSEQFRAYQQQQAMRGEGALLGMAHHLVLILEAARAEQQRRQAIDPQDRRLAEAIDAFLAPFVYDRERWQREGRLLLDPRHVDPRWQHKLDWCDVDTQIPLFLLTGWHLICEEDQEREPQEQVTQRESSTV